MPLERRTSAYAALAIGVFAISWSAIFVRWTDMPGIASAFYRVLFASMALAPFLLRRRNNLRMTRPSILLAILGGAFFAGDLAFFNSSVLQTSASSATFLANNAPLVVALITWAVTRKLPSRRFWLAFAVAIAGATLIVAIDKHHTNAKFSADLMAVAASICFAFYLAVTERLRGVCSTTLLLTTSTVSSAVVLFLCAGLTRTSLRIPGLLPLLALIGLGCLCQVIGYFCLTYALGHLPATVSSITLLAVAPLTAVLAFILFGERITGLQVLGNGLVLTGVWIISQRDPSSATRANSLLL
jgi:drug/metabolite transporter (DMT)-like permease